MWAFLLDSICLTALLVPAALAIYGVAYFSPTPAWFRGPADIFLQIVLPFVLVFWFWKRWLATPGKMLLASKIVDAESGSDPSSRQLIVRYLGYFASLMPLGLGFLWIAADPRKQGWHDKMAGTVVVVDCSAEGSQRLWRLLVLATVISLSALALGGLVGAAWLWNQRASLASSWEAAQRAQDEGVLWGSGNSGEACVEQALQRLDRCQGWLCGYRSSLFLGGCLFSCESSTTFCDQVPTSWSSLLSWQQEHCRRLGRSDLGCLQVMSIPVAHCRQLAQQPPEVTSPGFVQ